MLDRKYHEVVFQDEGGAVAPTRRQKQNVSRAEESVLLGSLQIKRGQKNRRALFLGTALLVAVIVWLFLASTESSRVTGKLVAPLGYKVVMPLNEPPRIEKK